MRPRGRQPAAILRRRRNRRQIQKRAARQMPQNNPGPSPMFQLSEHRPADPLPLFATPPHATTPATHLTQELIISPPAAPCPCHRLRPFQENEPRPPGRASAKTAKTVGPLELRTPAVAGRSSARCRRLCRGTWPSPTRRTRASG
eukprot:8346046-Alexandrium_andersonii.AAC.1